MLYTLRQIPAKFPLLVFLVSAGVGVWASYDTANAWAKFTTLVLAAILYLFLALWPARQMGLLIGLLTGLAAGISAYFLLTANWVQTPGDLGLINGMGLAWMSVRPSLPGNMAQFHPNIAGGLIAAFFPFGLIAVRLGQKKHWALFILALLSVGLYSAGLLLSSSRAAWFSLGIGMALWWWWWFSRLLAQRLGQQHEYIFGLPVALGLLTAVILIGWQFGRLVNLANNLPGAASATSRVEMAWNSLQLSRDFLLTGGGLMAFPGLYALYMRVIQVYEFGYAHNLYLDLLVEQGIFGLVAFLWIIIASLASTWRSMRHGLLPAPALLAGLVVLLLHGFLDDAFYGMNGTLLVFILPGIAAANGLQTQPASVSHSSGWKKSLLPAVCAAALLIILGVLPATRAFAQSNLACIQMAKAQLTGWPAQSNGTAPMPLAIQHSIQAQFNHVLRADPTNATALYRLGLIAAQQNNFLEANRLLQNAFVNRAGDGGIRKTLGYSYAWLDQTSQAAEILKAIPEAASELETYIWWWETQNRTDLASYAKKTLFHLQP